MKCKFDQKLLSFYLDNELSDEETRKVELHLKECEACRKKLSELREVSNVLNKLGTVEVSADYDVRFKKRFDDLISKKEEPPEKVTPWERKKLWEEVKHILSGAPTAVKVTVATILIVTVSFTLFALRPGSFPTIITAKGKIEKFNPELQSWKLLEAGDTLRKGDVIKTAKNSFIDIELDGSYKLRVKPKSKVLANKIVRSRRKGITQFELDEGNLLVKIEKPLVESKFQIKTPLGLAEAKGTAFMVDMDSVEKEALLGVSEGAVVVKTPKKECLINENEKVVVTSSGDTRGPYPLEEKDEKNLEEIKEIGKIFVVLGITDTPQRTLELLRPSRLYTYGKYPIEVGKMLDRALILLSRASKTNNRKLHLASIKEFEKIVQEYPRKRYNPQILLFVASYYEYLWLHSKAIDTFKEVVDRYPDTEWASIATLAQAIIYKEKLKDVSEARKLYDKILTSYPKTPEAKFVKNNVGLISN